MTITIGEQLKQARLDRKLSIKKASEITAIRSYYIEAMEADNFDSLPSPVHARGFLRSYANYLGVNIETLQTANNGNGENPAEPTIEKVEPVPVEQPAPAEPIPSSDYIYAETPPAPPENPAADIPESLFFPSLPYQTYDEEEEQTPDFVNQHNQRGSYPLSRTIFIEIGQQLKGRRELLGLSIEEIERHTHIRKHHLRAIENGDFDDLPSPVQSRGMLTAYSRFLDLDAETLLLRFADALQAARLERHPQTGPRKNTWSINKPTFIQRILSTDIVFGGGLVVVMLAFAIWGAARIITIQNADQTNQTAPQSISEELLATPLSNRDGTFTPTVSAISTVDANNSVVGGEQEVIPTTLSDAPVQVTTIITGRTWMRVSIDGKVEFEKRVQSGNVLTFEGEKQIELLIADGNFVQVIYNQEDLGIVGLPGEIINYIYTANGVLNPTPTPSPVPTRTPRPSQTPKPSPTLRPSRTPKVEN